MSFLLEDIMPKLLYCTTSDIIEAKKIAKVLLEEKLVACVNIIPTIQSMYRWKGAIETGSESALFIKTVDEKIGDTIARVKELHSYDVAEIIVLDLVDGSKDYFEFLRKETV